MAELPRQDGAGCAWQVTQLVAGAELS